MSDTLAVVSRKWRERAERHYGPLRPGVLLDWNHYESEHPFMDRYLKKRDRLFLVTVPSPGTLWLVSLYENVMRGKRWWRGERNNRTRIVDITHLKTKLKFHTGKGLHSDPAKLSQEPRSTALSDSGGRLPSMTTFDPCAS